MLWLRLKSTVTNCVFQIVYELSGLQRVNTDALGANWALYALWLIVPLLVALSIKGGPWGKQGRGGDPVCSLQEAISLFLFYLGHWVAPTWPQWGCSCRGLDEESRPQINSAIYGQARLTAAQEMGNIAHLAGLLGAVMPQRPGLWQAINVPRERQQESDWLALWWKVDLLLTPRWGTLWWMLPGCGERHWKGGEATFLCIMPVLDIPTVTQDGRLLLLAGPWEVVRLPQTYIYSMERPFTIQLADKWRGDLDIYHNLPTPPLTSCIPKASVISKDRSHQHIAPVHQSFSAIKGLMYNLLPLPLMFLLVVRTV